MGLKSQKNADVILEWSLTFSQLFSPCDFFEVNLDLPYSTYVPAFNSDNITDVPISENWWDHGLTGFLCGYAPGLIDLQNMCGKECFEMKVTLK